MASVSGPSLYVDNWVSAGYIRSYEILELSHTTEVPLP